MARLGMLDEWLEATARASEPAVRFSSCFPFQGETLLRRAAAKSVAAAAVVEGSLERRAVRSAQCRRNRWRRASRLSEDGWTVDGPSECLLPFSAPPAGSVPRLGAIERRGRSRR